MKTKILFPVLFLLLFATLCAAQPTAQNKNAMMTKEERAKVIKLLLDSNKETLQAVEKLTDAQWNFKAAPEKWSAGEVAEHIWLAENLLFSAVEKALANPVNPKWEEQTKDKDAFLEKILLNRQGKAQAPEAIKPTDKSRADVIKGLKESRAKTLKFAKQTKLALKEHTSEHPFKIFGTLNAYNWLIYIPLHNLRHNQQIAEVKSSPNFPK